MGKTEDCKGYDTFFRLADGSLRYVEYTTKADGIVAKMKEDIDACLDPAKTGVPTEEIDRIIICFNSRITVEQERDVTQYANERNVKVELIGLDWLALEIYSRYLILAKDILGLPLDTGQLLPLQNFVEEYNNRGGKLSTPLDNIFIHRETELQDLQKELSSIDILLLVGTPGVGKTKIALESLNRFLAENTNYVAFAVAKKDQDIAEDLKIHLQQDEDYVLLVDDANRQLVSFKQILAVFREKRKGNLKILITVRDYALNDVMAECNEYDPKILEIKKFSDAEIIDLVLTESFGINDETYQRRIVEVADGNARLAVMAARIAIERHEAFLFGDVSELYDTYFQTFVKDFDVFANKAWVKTLGIISFFFTIDRRDKEFMGQILELFDVDYHEFIEAIDELEKRELLEVRYDHARVSEQVLATYFFYRVFIKDQTLSFDTLIVNFFPKWKARFSDTIIPANNSFGYKNVLDKISGTLAQFLQSIYGNEKTVLAFFDVFWFYMREETLAYFHRRVSEMPEPESATYLSSYELNDFVFDRDTTLDYLSKLFKHPTESFSPALELAFEYCRKNPESLPELMRRIKEEISFREDDHGDFQRQTNLFVLLVGQLQQGMSHYREAFFSLSKTFLSHFFQGTKGGRNHAIVMYKYPLPVDDSIREFRRRIWVTLFQNFDSYPAEVLSVLSSYNPGYDGTIVDLLAFDLSLLLSFIDEKLDPNSFHNAYFIFDFVDRLDREVMADRGYRELKIRFNNQAFADFQVIEWSVHRGKHSYEFESHEEFEKLKEEDIRRSFVFQAEGEFVRLHDAINNALSIDDNQISLIAQSIDIIIHENYSRNDVLGRHLLESVLYRYPNGLMPLYNTIKLVVEKSSQSASDLWTVLSNWEHEIKEYWQLAFFECLPGEFATFFYRKELLRVMNSITQPCLLRFESYNKFNLIEPESIWHSMQKAVRAIPIVGNLRIFQKKELVEQILEIIYLKIEFDKIRITLSYHFFEAYADSMKGNVKLLKKVYLQQNKIAHNFVDFQHVGLRKILEMDRGFLLEYLAAFYIDNHSHRGHSGRQFEFIWSFADYKTLLVEAVLYLIRQAIYVGITDHPINAFFWNLHGESSEKAQAFINDLVSKYNADRRIMNALVDVFRHSRKDFFEEGMLQYLSLNVNVEAFKEIMWTGNGGTYSGDVNPGEVRAKEWQRILAIVNKSPKHVDLIPIKAYLKQRIEGELISAENERQRRFMNPRGW